MAGRRSDESIGHHGSYINTAFDKNTEDEASGKQANIDNNNNNVVYDFEVVLKEIGGMGKYQLLLVMMVYYVAIPAGNVNTFCLT